MIRIVFFVLGAVLVSANIAYSGAAVAMQNKKGAGGKPQQARPPQLPPGYVMGPNGPQKIPEVQEPESSVEEEEEAAVSEDDADLDQIVEVLKISSQSWALIIRKADKAVVVDEFIKQYQDQGVTIQKPAEFYVNFIDQMAEGSPEMLDMPFERVLQVVSVMEYDFDNGQNKDMLAQRILGTQVYEKNKKRLMNTQ